MMLLNLSPIRKSFKEFFSEPDIELSEDIQLGQVYSLELVGSGWTINYRLDKQNDELQLDFYAYHRMTNSRHKRILENGEIISLENFWEFGYQVYKNDQERTERERNEVIIRNTIVEDILRQKGLL